MSAHLREASGPFVPPHDIDAEMSVLSAMMLSDRVIDEVSEAVAADDFYRRTHGIIFTTCLELARRSEPVDALTVSAALEQSGQLELIGGRAKMHELAAWASASGNAPHYARIVSDHAGRRKLLTAAASIRQSIESGGALDELQAAAERHLTEAVVTEKTSSFTTGADIDELWGIIEKAYRDGTPRVGLLTGFHDLDRITIGLHPGQLILVAARPAMGKSAFGLNVAENIVDLSDRSYVAAYFSLEMSEEELKLRSLSRAAKVNGLALRSGVLKPHEYEKVLAALPRVRGRSGLKIDDNSGITVSGIRAACRRLKRTEGLDLVIVDYLQLMIGGGGSEDNRQALIAGISRDLKLLAKELQVPVVALSQLNRNVEHRQEKRPMLSDLRDSGALEQDADVVMFLYRDDHYNPNSPEPGVCEVIVAKQRMGPTGTAKLDNVLRHSSFTNPAKPQHAQEG